MVTQRYGANVREQRYVKLELYDCTLREGEQAAGAKFDLDSRVKLFSALDDFGMDYIELGYPVSSLEVARSFEECRKVRKNAKIVAFGSTCVKSDLDKDANLLALIKSKADYACIFGKTHLEHVKKQLKVTPKENLSGIKKSVEFLRENGMGVFYDAEHFFDAYKEDKKYALATVRAAIAGGAQRIVLCDTNGGTLPREVEKIVAETYAALKQYNVPLGIHFHNDLGLASANALVSLGYISQIQGTINGTGERTGNLDFSQFIPVYISKLKKSLNVKKIKLKLVNDLAYTLAGLPIAHNKPIVGKNAFAHKGGMHIDAVVKGAKYEHISPEEYGNKRVIILNTLGGKAGTLAVASQFGYKLDKGDIRTQERIENLFKELHQLEEKGYDLGDIPAEQYMLIEKHFGHFRSFFNVSGSRFLTERTDFKDISKFFMRGNLGHKPVRCKTAIHGGPVDVVYKTLTNLLSKKYPLVKDLKLVDFHISIAKKNAEASTVRTIIGFEDGENFETVGVDSNMFQSSLEALIKGLRYYLNRRYGNNSQLGKI